VPLVHLPIGVSFVTFEALSYVVDVYRGDTPAARNPLHVAFYVSFFPHLIAGPILRFRDIAGAVARPAVSLELFESGVSRFSVGLAKKMLLANPLGAVADTIFGLGAGQLRTSTAWLGIVAYALQIYFDFSGYSDMAIGLGRMFGFSLPENFRLPYAAESIQDFWRRWHVTLSSWFRDYVFIPLGGSRGTRTRTYRNLILVFLLCGLWHGASWNFAIWGLFHGTFLVLERSPFGGWLKRAWRPLRHAYAILVISIGWVFFRADSLGAAAGYLASMAGATVAAGPRPVEYFSTHFGFALACGALLSVAPVGKLRDRLLATNDERWRAAWRLGAAFGELALVFTSMLFVASDTYSPFIYFRF
ncbi:MAG TPA: MBOAT family O-acyltransferase, partial [Polyangiaceae bacterium]|nr:MBOAT family O-acyltransferase [Polyangiaceae bacterium]